MVKGKIEMNGATGSQSIDHPILITECVCNPVWSRSKMAELVFETYGFPSVAFGVDAAFSYVYNQHHGVCDKDGIAICPGFSTTHVIPWNWLEVEGSNVAVVDSNVLLLGVMRRVAE
ncbi:hypothetical protein ACFE04_017886 [Oxalis oulophora]